MIKIKFDREEMRSIAYDTDTTKEIGECCFIETKNCFSFMWDCGVIADCRRIVSGLWKKVFAEK